MDNKAKQPWQYKTWTQVARRTALWSPWATIISVQWVCDIKGRSSADGLVLRLRSCVKMNYDSVVCCVLLSSVFLTYLSVRECSFCFIQRGQCRNRALKSDWWPGVWPRVAKTCSVWPDHTERVLHFTNLRSLWIHEHEKQSSEYEYLNSVLGTFVRVWRDAELALCNHARVELRSTLDHVAVMIEYQ